MSTPRTKRQFAGASADPAQRQITSFFAARAPGVVPTIEAPRQPILPSSVQSNLLSVGMRVRKSVPEGYKTGSASAFKLWTDNTPASRPSAVASIRSSSRELLPFCGINSVGGLESQPEFRYEENEIPALDDIPELTMSQESVEGNEPSRKRLFDDDDSEPLMSTFNPKSWDAEGSSRGLAPAEYANARVMAMPKTRATRKSLGLKDVGQENMAVDNDFEDAEFLVFGEGAEMDTTI